MSFFYLYFHHDLEKLAELLTIKMAELNPDPFQPDYIIVQSRGMEQWLNLYIAKNQGISANLKFPFPNNFFSMLYKQAELPEQSISFFEPSQLTWEIYQIFRDNSNGTLPESIIHSMPTAFTKLITSQQELDIFYFSRALATLYDNAMSFHPRKIIQWERETAKYWQGQIWQFIRKQNPDKLSRVNLAHTFINELPRIHKTLPKRIFLFNNNSLSPLHLALLKNIKKYCEVHFFFLSPAKTDWFNYIQHPLRQNQEAAETSLSIEELFLTSNPLLASLSMHGRRFLKLLYDMEIPDNEFPEDSINAILSHSKKIDIRTLVPEPAKPSSLLEMIKEDLLLNLSEQNLRTLRAIPDNHLIDDYSLTIHAAHSKEREMEILRNFLLHCFATMNDLKPSDILVLMPNIEQYTPYIHAVFGNAPKSEYIPFSIADRSLLSESPFVQAFLLLISIYNSRFEVSLVYQIMNNDFIRRQFQFSIQDMDIIQHLIHSLHIHWGVDANHRLDLELPPVAENTWIFGLKRLFLGTMLSTDNTFKSTLPYLLIAEGGRELAAKWILFFDNLTQLYKDISMDRSLKEWVQFIQSIVDLFLYVDDPFQKDKSLFNQILMDIQEQGEIINLKISFSLFNSYLQERISIQKSATSFSQGKLIFGMLQPMRSLPFRVIAVLGLNDSSFPRHTSLILDLQLPADENEKAISPDQDKRQEDIYIFLETIFSAKERLFLSYIGQNINDNEPIPSSIVLTELMEYIDNNYTIQKNTIDSLPDNIRDYYFTRHSLYPWSDRYFTKKTDNPLHEKFFYSYDAHFCRNIHGSDIVKDKLTSFAAWQECNIDSLQNNYRIKMTGETLRISLIDFMNFWKKPQEYYIQKILGFKYQEMNDFTEHESTELDNLLKFNIAADILSQENDSEIFTKYFQSGQLPHQQLGKLLYHEFYNQIIYIKNILNEKLCPITYPIQSLPLEIQIDIQNAASSSFSGYQSSVYQILLNELKIKKLIVNGNFSIDKANRFYFIHYAKFKAESMIDFWLQHLFLMASYFFEKNLMSINQSIMINNDFLTTLNSMKNEQATQIIQSLLPAYLLAQNQPVPFLPRTLFAHYLQNENTARKEFEEETKKSFLSLIYPNLSWPLPKDFMQMGDLFFRPLKDLPWNSDNRIKL